jgi:hypothetical protein
MLLPRHRRPSRRPQLSAQRPIRTTPTRHRDRPPPSRCDDRLNPPSTPPSPTAKSWDGTASSSR